MVRKILFAAMISVVCVLSSFAQKGEEKAVISVVQRLFDEMAAANTDGIRSTMISDPQLGAIAKTPDGKAQLSVIGLEQFTKFFTKPGGVEEILYDPKVKMDDDWAMV